MADSRENSAEKTSSLSATISTKIRNAFNGWKLYFFHSIRNAGIALSCFYMTVLGLDNITYAYCLSQCVTEWQLGVLVGVSAVIGVAGSTSFPFLRRRMGLDKTGIFGMILLVAMLSLCVISIWLDGSPFDPNYFNKSENTTEPIYTDTSKNESLINEYDYIKSIKSTSNDDVDCEDFSFLSVYILLAGMVLARFGLWISDLTITQIIQVFKKLMIKSINFYNP